MMGRKKKFSVREKTTYNKILAYSTKIFFDRGFIQVSIEEICRALNISKATFYKYFSNREELVQVVAGRVWRKIEPVLWENLNSDKPIDEILNSHFMLQLDILRTRLSTRLLGDIQTHLPGFWSKYYAKFREKETMAIVKLIKDGQARGLLRSDIDSDLMGKVYHAVIDSMTSPNFLLAYDLTPMEIAEILNLAIRSLMTKPPLLYHKKALNSRRRK